MALHSASTLLGAWVLVPLLVAIASWGLGAGLALATGADLGQMTLPAGFLTGIAIVSTALSLGLAGVPTVILCGVVALAGFAATALRRARPRNVTPDLLWPAGTALVAYGIGMAALAGSGRSGVLGYVLNNDSAIHLSLIELIHAHGAQTSAHLSSSVDYVSQAFKNGYPLGSYTWVLFGRTLTGMDPFHLWSPMIAVSLAMLALVLADLLRGLGAPRPFAAVGGVVIAAGHMTFAFAVQGSAKEVIMPVALYGAVSLTVRLFRRGITVRGVIAPALAATAAVGDLGYPALAWIGPAAVAALGVLVVRTTRRRTAGDLRGVAVLGGAAVAVALPALLTSIRFYNSFKGDVTNAKEVGNLIGPVSIWQSTGVWLAKDYRLATPDKPGLTYVGIALVAALAIVGLAYAARRRDLGLLLCALGAAVGTAIVVPNTSEYFDAKAYVVLAPAVGLAAAAGLLAVGRLGPPGVVAAWIAAVLAVGGVAASDAYAYAGVWITPGARFRELADIGNRFAHRGPILVSDREQYDFYFLRRSRPWDDWGYRSLYDRPHLRFPNDLQPPLPRNPDFDDYPLQHIESFRYLLERRGPGASLPPRNFHPVYETAHYRVWERGGPAPALHAYWGVDGHQGAAPVKCRRGTFALPRAAALVRAAAAAHKPVIAAVGGAAPRVVVSAAGWRGYTPSRLAVPPGEIGGRGGAASGVLDPPRGLYDVWLQGSFGSGVRVSLTAGGRTRMLGEVRRDLGLPDGWQPFGRVDIRGPVRFDMIGLTPPRRLAGGRHDNIIGPLVVQATAPGTRIVTLPASRAATLCGRSIDWLEMP